MSALLYEMEPETDLGEWDVYKILCFHVIAMVELKVRIAG